jgi:hypothetical protein
MSVLGWEIHRGDRLVVISGVGVFDLPFLVSYRQAMLAQGTVPYRKLFDLHQTDIQLTADELQGVAENARNNNASISGPIAMVMGREPPPLLLDMAILLKQRLGTARRFRLFTDEAEARQWLASEPILAQPAETGRIALAGRTDAGPQRH